MTPNETKARKRIKRNFKALIDDVVLYCKINVELLSEDVNDLKDAERKAFLKVLKRLGKDG